MSPLEFDRELEEREASFNHKIRNHICQFLKDVHLDFIIVVGHLVRIFESRKLRDSFTLIKHVKHVYL